MMAAFTNDYDLFYPDSPLCQVPATPVLMRQTVRDTDSPAFAVVPNWTPETTQENTSDTLYTGPGTPGTPARTLLSLPSSSSQAMVRRPYPRHLDSPVTVPRTPVTGHRTSVTVPRPPECSPCTSSRHATPLETTPENSLKKKVLKKRLLASSRVNRNLVPSTPLSYRMSPSMTNGGDAADATVGHNALVQARECTKRVALTFGTAKESDSEQDEGNSGDARREVTALSRSSETHGVSSEVRESADLLDLI